MPEEMNELQKGYHELRLALAETAGDVRHIKERLDNGMSKTLTEICNAFLELKPKIEYHDGIIKRIVDLSWWILKSVGLALLLAVVGITIWALSNGWNPGLRM